MTHEVYYTALALLFTIGLGLISWRRHNAPHDKLAPRMVPWMIIAMACLATNFMILVHLVNLFGFETGRGR